MKLGEACAVIAAARKQVTAAVPLVATMSAQFAFDMLGETKFRIDSVPLMGGAAGIGLGLALARPDLAVIVVDGDSSLLMELGGLVTVAHNKPARLIHFVVNNGVQFNGLVNLPRAGTSPNCDFAAMAKAAGYSRSQKINDLMVLTSVLQDLLVAEGASFIELVIEADPAFVGQSNPQPLLPDLQFQRMRAAVGRLKSELEAC